MGDGQLRADSSLTRFCKASMEALLPLRLTHARPDVNCMRAAGWRSLFTDWLTVHCADASGRSSNDTKPLSSAFCSGRFVLARATNQCTLTRFQFPNWKRIDKSLLKIYSAFLTGRAQIFNFITVNFTGFNLRHQNHQIRTENNLYQKFNTILAVLVKMVLNIGFHSTWNFMPIINIF